MEANDVLRRMSQLVRERPGVTVRELARALGFSQERSVYYWLNKADFQGIRQFREAVLRGEVGTPSGSARTATAYAVPLYRFSQIPFPSQEPPPTSRHVLVDVPPLPELFAVEAEGSEYVPLIEPQDQLIIDPSAEPRDGDLVLVVLRGYGPAIRRIFGQNPTWLVHPCRGRPLEAHHAPPVILGRVTRLLRSF
ncbi:MAG TPA: S24 family peptidase [Limnochorda sp.]